MLHLGKAGLTGHDLGWYSFNFGKRFHRTHLGAQKSMLRAEAGRRGGGDRLTLGDGHRGCVGHMALVKDSRQG